MSLNECCYGLIVSIQMQFTQSICTCTHMSVTSINFILTWKVSDHQIMTGNRPPKTLQPTTGAHHPKLQMKTQPKDEGWRNQSCSHWAQRPEYFGIGMCLPWPNWHRIIYGFICMVNVGVSFIYIYLNIHMDPVGLACTFWLRQEKKWLCTVSCLQEDIHRLLDPFGQRRPKSKLVSFMSWNLIWFWG